MNILMFEPRAKKVTFAADNMWVEFTEGRQLGVPLAYFPRLLNAAQRQRDNYTISGGGTGLHWDDLEEDISVKSLLDNWGQTLISSFFSGCPQFEIPHQCHG